MKEATKAPNPAGRNGKLIILPPPTFEDAVKKMLNTPCWEFNSSTNEVHAASRKLELQASSFKKRRNCLFSLNFTSM
jgi:hypothetical protein